MKYVLSPYMKSEFLTKDSYHFFESTEDFAYLFLGSYDKRFMDSDKTLNIYSIQEVDIPPPKEGELNVLWCFENCNYHKHYKHYNKYGDYGDKNIQIYIYNHIDKIVKTDDYIAFPLLWIYLKFFEKHYESYKPIINRKKEQQKFSVLMTPNFHNKNIKYGLLQLCSTIDSKSYHIYNFKDYLKNLTIFLNPRFIDFINNFRFAIVCENSPSDGYITEKIFNCFHARVIPIYYGNNPERYFHEGSFINASKLSFQEIRDKIIELNNNDELYNKMINHPKLKNPNVDYFRELVEFINNK